MCDCNFICKIVAALVLVVAFLVNTVSGLFGGEDLIPTHHCYLGCTCYETTTEEETTTPSTDYEESTTIPSTTESTTDSTTESVTESTSGSSTESSTESTTESTTESKTEVVTGVRPPSTKPLVTDAGPHITNAIQASLSVFGGSGDDIYRGIAPTSDGGYVVCGTTDSIDGDLEEVYTNTKWKKPYGFIARYSKNGSLRWLKAYASSADSVMIEDVTVLSDGSIIAVGYSKSNIYAANIESIGSYDAVIFHLASTGYLKSTRSIGGSKTDMFTCVAATENGYVVGGTTYSTDGDFEGVPGTSAIIMNFGENYTVLWKKFLHGNAASKIGGVACDDEGNIFATCLTSSTTGDFSVFENLIGGYTDTVVLKYDKNGDFKWGYEISSSGRDEFAAVTPDGNGGCVVAGNYELIPSNFPDGTLQGIHHCGNIDSLVFRINKDGTQRWVKILSGFENDFITDVVKTDGGFAIAGYTKSGNREFATIGNEGAHDAFVTFVNTNGTTVDTFSQAGTNEDMATCITYTTEGKIIAAGKTQSTDVDFAGINTYSNVTYLGYMSNYDISVG